MSSSLEATPIDIVALRKKFDSAGQGHVFRFWDDLSPEQQGQLVQQLANLDVDRVNDVYQRALEGEKAMQQLGKGASADSIEPPLDETTVGVQPGSSEERTLRDIGLDAIAKGQVGVLLMAGGQGTRLGSSAPKGCYDIGLPSGKSLFQLQAERIQRLQALAAKHANKTENAVVITWFIMTSGPTRKPTEEFFREHKFFGLKASNVVFFEQGTLPCLTMEGKVMMDLPYQIATAPDGNGGIYRALRQPLDDGQETVLTILQNRNIQYLHCYGVDNCLVRVGDPVFIGVNIQRSQHERRHQSGVKTVKKVDPSESVGIIARRNGQWTVVEYSELPKSLAEEQTHDGQLAYRAANIVNHFFTFAFLRDDVEAIERAIPFHIARKKIPSVDLTTGKVEKPTSPNGMKLELFIFDVFPHLKSDLSVYEVQREEEFAPLKNARGTGVDDPDTSRSALLSLHRRWLEQAGAQFASADVAVEISPLVSYSGEGLEAVKVRTFSGQTTLDQL